MKQLLVVCLLGVAAFGQKSVFIQNDSGYASVYDAANSETRKHFTVVDSKKDADLVFSFTRRAMQSGAHTSGQIEQDGTYSSHTSVDHAIIIELDVLDGKTGDKLWSNSREWAAPYPNLYAVSLLHKVKPPSKKLVDDYVKSH